ncbi:thioesterase family protein [Rufibacter sp. LB8]|uniref:acyl-CoA thioesterase n=1 Tax=Rufibacter sp. LB8 TaxID=2777781 RepID=UPI00178C7367|nr:thioesterase family protein [Rufibacter sp. LB8]
MSAIYEGHVIWAQVDANMHLRHSAYADFAAQARIALLDSLGLNFKMFQKLRLGPILFKEELHYLREVGLNENIQVKTMMTKAREDGSRWSIKHELYRQDGIKACIILVDGAWMDLAQRKLTALPADFSQQFLDLPKSEDFVLEQAKN